MSESTTPSAAPGWYPDPSDPSRVRWWDGAAWSERRDQAYTTSDLRAPDGTKTSTPWIWLIIFLPFVACIPLFFIDWGGMFRFDADDPTAMARAMTSVLFSPAYVLATLGAFVLYGLNVLFAYLDHKALLAAGVPKPFHWAFGFISNYVYPIGRSVVVKRRTGRDGGTLVASILALVLGLLLGLVLAVVMMTQMMAAISTYYPTY